MREDFLTLASEPKSGAHMDELEALRAGRVRLVRIHDRSNARLGEVVRVAEAKGVPVQQGTFERLDRDARYGVHQGVVAEVDDPGSYTVAELVRVALERGLITPSKPGPAAFSIV